jgi:hypothetical protein
MTYIGSTDTLKVRRGLVGATTTITGPNDARRVVWALGEFFFLISFFFFVFNCIYRSTDALNVRRGSIEVNDDDNGPKRRETRRLGPM